MEFKGLKSITKNERANGSGFLGNFAVSPTLPFYNGGFTDARITNAFEYASRAESSFLGYKNEFVPPYSIRFLDVVINYENLPFNLYMFTTHANNLSTIDSNTGEAFATLVKYDIRRILWNEEFKFLNGLETTSATVNLQIDDWAQAEDKREEYLKELEDTRISSMPMTIAI